ncbi:MAG: chemotaxis response regulator protein-glutamate methylesterase [Proteobacteria bacterium]|nr:chemotaxis response regulator protein-glutamate methylesterase [Pseudomonadota bacterium]
MKNKIKVLIVDDSALVRKMLTEILGQDRGIEVVGTALDPFIARDKIKKLNPDVITLDVEMPKMDGLTFLDNLMRLRPMPVVMVSTLTEKGADITLQALELGAIDFVSKPKSDFSHSIQDYSDELIEKVKAAAGANVRARDASVARKVAMPNRSELATVVPKLSADAVLKKTDKPRRFRKTDRIIAIGASTGGTEAIKEVLMSLPADCPGIVVVQHIPGAFSKPFADRMDRYCSMKVYEAEDGQQILPGSVYIAPGSHHLLVERDGAHFICRLSDGPAVNRHKPSVDVLFRSVAQNAGPNSVGVILTGMGDDGARGLKEMKDAGASAIAQDEKTSVVWGMPGAAVQHGSVDSVLPLQRIGECLLDLATR